VAVPTEAIEAALTYVMSLRNEKDGGFGYTMSGTGSNVGRTGMALYLLQKAGRGDSAMAASAAAYLAANPPGRPGKRDPYDFYGIYWASLALGLRGGEAAGSYAAGTVAYGAASLQEDGSVRDSLGPVLATISLAAALAESR
jgi:hypothetical protein